MEYFPPNGESFQEAKKRVTHLLDEIANQQDVVIVAHGPLIKLLEGVGAIFQKPKHSLWMNRRTDFTVSSMRIENILYRFSWA